MELHQDLAHHTHTRLQPLAGQRQRIEVFYDAAHRLLELAALQATAQLRLARRHPVVEQAVRAALLDLVRTRAVQRHHQQVAVEDGVCGLQQHGRRHLEAGVALAQILERQRDDGNMRQPHRGQRLADKRDIVRGAAAAACLRDDDRQLVGIVAAGHDGLHDLTGDQHRRIADVVVHVLEARIHRPVVNRRQQLEVVAVALENVHEQVEMDGCHLRAEDGVARVLHLLREHGARELGGGAFALLEALGHLGRRLLGERPGHRARDLGGDAALGHAGFRVDGGLGRGEELVGVERHRRAAARRAFGLGLLVGLVLERRQQAAHADARRAQVRHLVDFEDGVHLARRLEDLLHLVGGQRVQTAAEAVQLDEVEVGPLGGHLRRRIQARVVHPLVHQADGALQRAEVRDGVLGEHRQAEAGQKLGDGMVDLGVVVVGAPGQHDAVRARGLHPGQRLLALRADVALERLVLGPRGVHGGVNLGLRRRAGRSHELRRFLRCSFWSYGSHGVSSSTSEVRSSSMLRRSASG